MPKFIHLPDLEVIEKYISNKFTMKEICEFYKVSNPKILSILKKNGIELKSQKKYQYNDDIFEIIDNEEKSYWLGFLYADGFLRQRKGCGNELKLKLSINDIDHLNKFTKFISISDLPIKFEETINKGLNKDGNPYNNSRLASVSISSKKIVGDLILNGCLCTKSKFLKFPNLPDNLMNHFIRGYFDGDGSISFSDKAITLNIVSASMNFLDQISLILNTQSGCKKSNLVGSSSVYRYIQWSTIDDIKQIYNYLYTDSSISMNRKKEKMNYVIDNYREIRSRINETNRERYARNKQII